MTTAVIVQARMGSSRFPGKVLYPLGDRTVLEQVLGRCARISGVDVVVCAIPDQGKDDVLMPFAGRSGVVVVRGSERDVRARYAKAADAVRADIVMRVTSDCPLIDPVLCGEVLERRAETNADYACNNMPFSFPHGLDCEAFTRAALHRALQESRADEDREHVTKWLRNDPGVRRAAVTGPGRWLDQRWTLDFPEDYAFLSEVFALIPSLPSILPWPEVAALVTQYPDLAAINRHRRSNPV